jgi:flagellar assembly factor FliW
MHTETSMQIQTSRFGAIDVDESRIITMVGGLLGFPRATRFALIQTGEDSTFFWLQDVQDANLAFVVCDPAIFLPDYTIDQVPVREEARESLGIEPEADLSRTTQVFAICNRVGDWLTGNLLGPIVINLENCHARQIVLTEKKWSTRQPLFRLVAERQALRKSA